MAFAQEAFQFSLRDFICWVVCDLGDWEGMFVGHVKWQSDL